MTLALDSYAAPKTQPAADAASSISVHGNGAC